MVQRPSERICGSQRSGTLDCTEMGFSCVMLAMATFSAWRTTLPTRSGQSRQQQAGQRQKGKRRTSWLSGAPIGASAQGSARMDPPVSWAASSAKRGKPSDN